MEDATSLDDKPGFNFFVFLATESVVPMQKPELPLNRSNAA